jgi:tRNA(Ile)-lysidine synthase
MGAVSPHHDLCILRPLLGVAPARLRATLRAASLAWAEDPTNTDRRFLRPRLRAELAASDPAPLLAAAADAGGARAAEDAAIATTIATCVAVHPAGFALLPPGPIAPAALAALIQAISGAAYPPRAGMVAACAAAPRAMTLGGARLLPAGRLGPGWLLIREAAAMAPPVIAVRGAVWDGRFALASDVRAPSGSVIGALGTAAAGLRRASLLPAAVLATLPALWQGERLIAVPHLLWPDPTACAGVAFGWQPARAAAAGAFLPPPRGCGTLMHALC